MLLVGYDEGVGPSLYFIDYMASMQKLDFGSHGYGGAFCNRWAPCAPARPVRQPSRAAPRVRTLLTLPRALAVCWTRTGMRTLARRRAWSCSSGALPRSRNVS